MRKKIQIRPDIDRVRYLDRLSVGATSQTIETGEGSVEIIVDPQGRPGIAVEDDAQVRAGDFANQNYGTLETLRVKTDTPVSFTYWSYIKINISGITQPVTSAKIRAIVNNIETADPGPRTITVNEVADDSWQEETITWNTRPAKGTALDSVIIQDDDNEKEFEWEVTSWVNANIADDFVSFVFTQDESATIGLNIYSKEANPAKAIRLVVIQ